MSKINISSFEAAPSFNNVVLGISTDKVDMDLVSPFTGKVIKLIVEEGSVINVGEVLAEIETEEDSLLGSIFD